MAFTDPWKQELDILRILILIGISALAGCAQYHSVGDIYQSQYYGSPYPQPFNLRPVPVQSHLFSGNPYNSDVDCKAFRTKGQAQYFFDINRYYLSRKGIHGLDRDGDGEACEYLPSITQVRSEPFYYY